MIVGVNNSGKTNLLRVLQFISENYGMYNLILAQKQKHDKNKNSRITLQVQLTDKEAKFVLYTMFDYHQELKTIPEELKILNITINWNDTLNESSPPNFIMYHLENGIAIIQGFYQNIVFDRTDKSQSYIDKLSSKLKPLVRGELGKLEGRFTYESLDTHIINGKHILLTCSIKKEPISFFFQEGNRNRTRELPMSIYYHSQKLTKATSDILNYVKGDTGGAYEISLSELLHKIFKNNLTFIKEIHPTYQNLTNNLFNLKNTNEPNYKILQKEFSNIFKGIAMRVEKVNVSGNTSPQIILTENKKDFILDQSASGHYALIHIFYTILSKPDQILIMDEPEIHFHPTKISQLSQKLSVFAKSKNNQLVIISHSPKWISYKLLADRDTFSLTYLNKIKGTSDVKSLPDTFKNSIKNHLFNPEIFFNKCTIIVEGSSDKFCLDALSDHFGGCFQKYDIFVLVTSTVDVIRPNIEFHNAFAIPFVAMVDMEYAGDMKNVIRHSKNLEVEYIKIGCCQPKKKKFKGDQAYTLMQNFLMQKNGVQKVKKSTIWKAFEQAIKKAGGRVPN